MEIKASAKTLRRDLADVLTVAMITSARAAAQEYEENPNGVPVDVVKLKEFTLSAAYQHALKAYVAGTISLHDLARALEPMRPILPWLAGRE